MAGTPPLDRLRTVAGVTHAAQTGDQITVRGTGARLAQDVIGALTELDVPMRDLRTEQPSLEDVFLALTGREMREGTSA